MRAPLAAVVHRYRPSRRGAALGAMRELHVIGNDEGQWLS